MAKPKIDNPLFIKTEKEPQQQIVKEQPPVPQEVLNSQTPKLKESETLKVINSKSLKLPKFITLEPLLVRLRKDQIDFLDNVTKQIMKERSSKNKIERLTKNSIVRACVDAISQLDIDYKEIPDEKELSRRIIAKIENNTQDIKD